MRKSVSDFANTSPRNKGFVHSFKEEFSKELKNMRKKKQL